MSHNLKAVIFDMDGVVIDSELAQSLAVEIIVKEYGKTPIYNNNGLIQTIGMGGDQGYLEIIEKHNIKEDVKIFRKKVREVFITSAGKRISLMAGFIPLANSLRKKGIKTAIASNRSTDHVHIILRSVNIENYFDVIIGSSPLIKLKPHPDIFLHTAKKLKTDPVNCVVLEDTITGVIAGKKASMKVVAVPNKHTKSHNFSEADKIVEGLRKINLSLLCKMFN